MNNEEKKEIPIQFPVSVGGFVESPKGQKWLDQNFTIIPAMNPAFTIRELPVQGRILSEEEFQLAKQLVNDHYAANQPSEDHNQQPIEQVHHSKDGNLEVVNVWYTIQGEGPFAGKPAVFVRLAGCNLRCPLCDTDYTSNRVWYSPRTLVDKILSINQGARLVVLTGGEPFRQNFAPFVVEASTKQLHVQIETNGTLYNPDVPYDHVTVVCSPKVGKIHPKLEPHIRAFKYVLEDGQVMPDGLPKTTLGSEYDVARPCQGHQAEIYVQPLDSFDQAKNSRNMAATVQSCLKFGYRLCLQMHKIVGVE